MTFPIKISIIVEKEINKNGNKIQARYYWKNTLNLDDVEDDMKDKIKNKLILGL